MATQKKPRARVGPSNPKYAKAVKKATRSGGDAQMAGGDKSLGRTLAVKAHPSHPGPGAASARGRASGRAVPDAAQVGAKKHVMKKADAKKKSDK